MAKTRKLALATPTTAPTPTPPPDPAERRAAALRRVRSAIWSRVEAAETARAEMADALIRFGIAGAIDRAEDAVKVEAIGERYADLFRVWERVVARIESIGTAPSPLAAADAANGDFETSAHEWLRVAAVGHWDPTTDHRDLEAAAIAVRVCRATWLAEVLRGADDRWSGRFRNPVNQTRHAVFCDLLADGFNGIDRLAATIAEGLA